MTYLEAVSSWKNNLTSLIQGIVSSKTGTNVQIHHKNNVRGVLLQQEILTADLISFLPSLKLICLRNNFCPVLYLKDC